MPKPMPKAKISVDDFIAAYASGTTPNPCVRCNERVKFGDLLDMARELGADALATGLLSGPIIRWLYGEAFADAATILADWVLPAGVGGVGGGLRRRARRRHLPHRRRPHSLRQREQAKHRYDALATSLGHEVVPQGIRVLEKAARKFDISLQFKSFNWSCERYAKTGQMMPEDGLDQLKPFDSVLLGAVGYPGVPDHVSLWGLLIPIRRGFDQYVNLRPVRLFEGVSTPLANRTPKDIDFVVVPEPGPVALAGLGLALAWAGRRRLRSRRPTGQNPANQTLPR